MSDSDRFDRDQVEQYNSGELLDAWEFRVQELEQEGLTRSDAQAVADAERSKQRETLCAIEEHMRRIRQAIRKNDDFLLGALRKAGVIQ